MAKTIQLSRKDHTGTTVYEQSVDTYDFASRNADGERTTVYTISGRMYEVDNSLADITQRLNEAD